MSPLLTILGTRLGWVWPPSSSSSGMGEGGLSPSSMVETGVSCHCKRWGWDGCHAHASQPHNRHIQLHEKINVMHVSANIRWIYTKKISLMVPTTCCCHDRDIPPQPSHTYSCLLAVQTPPEHSLTKPEPIPGLPDPSIAFPNSSAVFLKGCCTDVCLVSIPEVVNIIPEHIWPFPMNPKHLKSHRSTPSLHTRLWTRRLSMHNRDRAKPERLAVFPIESYSFLPYLLLSVSPYPCPVPSCHSFPLSTLYPSSLYHTLLYLYTSVLTLTTTSRPLL